MLARGEAGRTEEERGSRGWERKGNGGVDDKTKTRTVDDERELPASFRVNAFSFVRRKCREGKSFYIYECLASSKFAQVTNPKNVFSSS